MIEHYLVVAGRIRQELADLGRVMARSEHTVIAARQRPQDQDLYFDAAVLNLHDFYTGLERVLHHIAATVDKSVPSGPAWHRDLLRQMHMVLLQIRPQVLSAETALMHDLHDRGFLSAGKAADITIFDPDTMGSKPCASYTL